MKPLEGWHISDLDGLVHVDLESLNDKTPRDFPFYYLDISSVSEGKINPPSIETIFRDAPSRARTIVHRGDVLMSTVRPNLKAFAYFDLADAAYIASTGFAVLTAREKTDPRFILYAILSDTVLRQIDALVSGSNYPAINTSAVRRLQILTPPKTEQTKIADILSMLDRTIEETEALIAKQQRIKTGLMQDLLTRGIDEQGNLRSEQTHEFKDSPLGRIPAEWEVKPCAALCRQIVVGIVIRPVQYYKPDGVPVLRSANVKENSLDPSNLVFMSEKDNEVLSKSQLSAGDLVTVRTGYPGTTAVIPHEFDGSNSVDVVISRPDPHRVRSEFLSLWINSNQGKRQILEGQGGLAQQHFNVGAMKSLLVKVPDLREQKRIEEILIAQRSADDRVVETLAKLVSSKTGLMQDLLTGRKRAMALLEEEPQREKVYAGQ